MKQSGGILDYEIDHEEKRGWIAITDDEGEFIRIYLRKETMIKLAKELQTVLKW